MLRAVGGLPFNSVQQLLFVLRGANMAITTDQSFTKLFSGTKYTPVSIISNYVSGAFNTACAGGIYTAAAKGGIAIVAAGQSYAALAANVHVNATIADTTTTLTALPILSLTTGNTGALAADFFIFGVCLD